MNALTYFRAYRGAVLRCVLAQHYHAGGLDGIAIGTDIRARQWQRSDYQAHKFEIRLRVMLGDEYAMDLLENERFCKKCYRTRYINSCSCDTRRAAAQAVNADRMYRKGLDSSFSHHET